MPSFTRHFLGWDRPLAELVGERLMARASERLIDLSESLVITPTRNSGRRLREMLANLANERGRALIPPQVAPPEFLLSLISEPDNGKTATPEESLLAWCQVLKKIDIRKFQALFPVEPVSQDFSWTAATAKGITELRMTLGESGLEIVDVVEKLGDGLEEADRWLELTRLELRYQQLLAKNGLVDLQSTRKARAGSPESPSPEIKRIIVAGTPDPVSLALRVLDALGESLDLEIWIFAPEGLADTFDRWGRPLVEVWSRRNVEIPDFDNMVRVLPNAMAQANAAAERVAACPDPSAAITLGVLDPEITPAIERRLAAVGTPSFNPDGEPLRSTGPAHFFRTLRDLFRERSYRAFIELLRCPDYAAYLSSTIIFWDTAQAFRQFDALYQRHLPSDLVSLRRFLQNGQTEVTVEQFTALDDTEKLLKQLEKKPLAQTAPEIFESIFTARRPLAGSDAENLLRAVSDRVRMVLDAAAGTLGKSLRLSSAEQLDLAIPFLDSERIYKEREIGAVELSGWLELLWDDSPHLVICGFNEGFVPESIVGDAYLPESLRRQLDPHVPFQTNDRRFARDAYLLASIAAWRRTRGRTEIFLGKRSQSGDPLRPSRLLFRCDDQQLPARARKLFAEAPPTERNLAWTPGFMLKASPPEKEIESIGVTSFAAYLESPLHFYLSRIERMRSVDGEKLELDVMDFGNFVHAVLHRFGAEPGVRDSTDEAEIRDYLHSQAEKLTYAQFGEKPPLPVRIQIRAAKQRLSAAARIQAADRLDGWKIARTEFELGDGEFSISGIAIKGKVDRLDRNEETGQLRVLDYKTSDTRQLPGRAHISRVTASTKRDWLPEYAEFELGGKDHRWLDLQLPLYRMGLGEEGAICGYFSLPKSLSDTRIDIWSDLDPEHDAAARRCAEGVIADVSAGKFWPWQITRRDDDFGSLHLSIPDLTIDPESLKGAAPESAAADPDLIEEFAFGIDSRPWRISRILPNVGDWIEPGEELVELETEGQICVLQATKMGMVTEVCARPGELVGESGKVVVRLKES
ncbi:MAG: ATP-dependent helicase/nuclease subunit B [Verrucomicrobiales bacterium]|jgi:ATP-dependent helicase/nuclease subunit B